MFSINARARAVGVAVAIASGLLAGGAIVAESPTASAAGCKVKFVASNWDAPGNDNFMPQLNQEWVRIKNTCSTAKSIGRWRIHDHNQNHTYRFPANFTIGGGKSITLRSGTGTNSATTRYWGFQYGAVWNNTGTERAHLKNAAGSTVHTWVEP